MSVGQVVGRPARSIGLGPLVADLVALTKPRIMELVVVTGATTSLIAAGGWPGWRALAAVIIGGGMAAGGAGSINCALEAELDRRMPRTRHRPVAAGRVPASVALAQGVLLNLLGGWLIVGVTNRLTAALTLAGTAWYVFVYTLWLKPRTSQNIVIGGVAGSFPPLAGWAAVDGGVSITAFALAAVVFLWTPPHFWALATVVDDDYREAGVPMRPSVVGAARTAGAMEAYAIATVGVSLVPVIVAGDLGILYLAVALSGGGWFIRACDRHRRRLEATTARRVFVISLGYLGALFLAAAADGVLL